MPKKHPEDPTWLRNYKARLVRIRDFRETITYPERRGINPTDRPDQDIVRRVATYNEEGIDRPDA